MAKKKRPRHHSLPVIAWTQGHELRRIAFAETTNITLLHGRAGQFVRTVDDVQHKRRRRRIAHQSRRRHGGDRLDARFTIVAFNEMSDRPEETPADDAA